MSSPPPAAPRRPRRAGAPAPPTTAAALFRYHDPWHRPVELVRGELVVHEPPGHEHGRVAMLIGVELVLHVRARAAATGVTPGYVAACDPGCWIERDPDTVRAPDVAYVAAERAPTGAVHGYLEGAPTLAVEVLSPTDCPASSRQRPPLLGDTGPGIASSCTRATLAVP